MDHPQEQTERKRKRIHVQEKKQQKKSKGLGKDVNSVDVKGVDDLWTSPSSYFGHSVSGTPMSQQVLSFPGTSRKTHGVAVFKSIQQVVPTSFNTRGCQTNEE